MRDNFKLGQHLGKLKIVSISWFRRKFGFARAYGKRRRLNWTFYIIINFRNFKRSITCNVSRLFCFAVLRTSLDFVLWQHAWILLVSAYTTFQTLLRLLSQFHTHTHTHVVRKDAVWLHANRSVYNSIATISTMRLLRTVRKYRPKYTIHYVTFRVLVSRIVVHARLSLRRSRAVNSCAY